MNILLNLCNSEMEFVATCKLHLTEDCRYAPPEIRQVFSDKILEYDWQEDQGDLTAIFILRDTVMELVDGLYVDIRLIRESTDCELDLDHIDFIRNNIIKGIGRGEELDEGDSAWISFFTLDAMVNNDCDVVITMAKEDGEEVR